METAFADRYDLLALRSAVETIIVQTQILHRLHISHQNDVISEQCFYSLVAQMLTSYREQTNSKNTEIRTDMLQLTSSLLVRQSDRLDYSVCLLLMT